MTDESTPTSDGTDGSGGGSAGAGVGRGDENYIIRGEWFATLTDEFVHVVELAAAAVFALLFAIGVVDLSLQIGRSMIEGTITDPLVVIGFIDTGLLLLIIVEVYQTVVAYIRESDTRRIVRLVIYTGVIAMVRKTIIFRTSEYGSAEAAFMAAVSYAILIVGLIGLLYVERQHGDTVLG